jgi:hypothetical protein
MLDFVARVFRGWMNVLLWLILISCVIGGFIAGGNIFGFRGFNFGYAFLGLLIGSLIGLITVVLAGGLIANFLNMVDDINSIKYHLSKRENQSSVNSSNSKPVNPIPTIVNYGDSWTCKKCGEKNPITSSSCKGCGEYK